MAEFHKHCKQSKPAVRDHILYNSIHMIFAEKANLWNEQITGCLGLWVGARLTANKHKEVSWGDGNILKWDCGDNCATINLL